MKRDCVNQLLSWPPIYRAKASSMSAWIVVMSFSKVKVKHGGSYVLIMPVLTNWMDHFGQPANESSWRTLIESIFSHPCFVLKCSTIWYLSIFIQTKHFLVEQTDSLQHEIISNAPDLVRLTFGNGLIYTIRANWKSEFDNFLECYHCPGDLKGYLCLGRNGHV